ncbi:hypothetical protein Q7C36_014590 [Tachysurus vachellii]|uniref:Uncharacterized protein n=1 Tax=Tachysurus vachellii TaxID=175792 RepID=A0AA88MGN2_TACVA|nr:hypothetical protein Q7C36_014590 [Tachysurus vachellii]
MPDAELQAYVTMHIPGMCPVLSESFLRPSYSSEKANKAMGRNLCPSNPDWDPEGSSNRADRESWTDSSFRTNHEPCAD